MAGAHKLLLELDGICLVRRVTLEALSSRASEILVVIGHRQEEVRAALSGLPVVCARNPDHERGLSTSVRVGVESLDGGVEGVLVCLGDMPFVRASELDALITVFEASGGEAIVVPTHDGRRGNPVLWPRSLFPELLGLDGDEGARGILGKHASRVRSVVIDAPSVLVDIDTPDDLEKAASFGAANRWR
jgi:molybdenum cofactor cytidylyltransferase